MPTQQDVQRLIALREARKRGMMGPTQTAALQEIERRMSVGDQVAKVAEPAMTIASSMVAEPLSGLAGIAGTILPGPQGQGADWVNRTQEALTYMPRTEGGMQSLQGLASLMQPVSDVMQGAEQSMGDFGYENFGPGVGAMMAAIPAAASEVAGVGKPARVARRADDVVDAARTADRMGDVSRRFTPDELMEMDVNDLDRMAFGVTSGEVKTVSPDDLNVIYDDDMLNPQEAFRRGGKEWAESVDLSEPIQVSVDEAGVFNIEDGHHRYFAAKLLGKPIKAEFEVKGNPARAILKRQGDM